MEHDEHSAEAAASRVRMARHAGFCFGVERAIRIAMSSTGEQPEAGDAPAVTPPIFTLGPLIHNQQVVQRLEELGVRLVEHVEDARGGTLLIRTHGVPGSVFEQAEALGIRVVDTTCPFVRRVHERARSLLEEGYEIVIVGEREHPEVIGIQGWIEEKAHIVERPEDLAALPRLRRVGVVAQTTQTFENLVACVTALLAGAQEVRVFNTLCDATTQRQHAARELACEVPVMVVVGGLHSGNTRRLAEICSAAGARTHHIETAGDLRPEWFADLGPEDPVGVTAGASTPEWIIREVVDTVEALLGGRGMGQTSEGMTQ